MNSILLFSILCIYYFCLGLLFQLPKYRTLSIEIFLSSLFIIPSGSFLVELYFVNQIYAWYFYLFGPTLVFIFQALKKNQMNYFAVKSIIGTLIFLVSFSIYGILIEGKDLVHILIDTKVIFLFLFGIAFSIHSKGKLNTFFEGKIWKWALALNFLIDTCLFFLNYRFNLAYNLTTDSHYLNDVARYADLSLAFLILYVIYKYLQRQTYSFLELIYIVLPIIY